MTAPYRKRDRLVDGPMHTPGASFGRQSDLSCPIQKPGQAFASRSHHRFPRPFERHMPIRVRQPYELAGRPIPVRVRAFALAGITARGRGPTVRVGPVYSPGHARDASGLIRSGCPRPHPPPHRSPNARRRKLSTCQRALPRRRRGSPPPTCATPERVRDASFHSSAPRPAQTMPWCVLRGTRHIACR